ncbi:MAG: hypothetical protein LBQ22_05465 [Bacteroidales bacterium]|jgi:hypothetical protein|nr:hypothetical protein [Bacteroidales bacterium]
METIEIAITEYYNKPQYFPFMPEVVFNTLEAAFLEGKETAEVPKAEFESMLSGYQNKK